MDHIVLYVKPGKIQDSGLGGGVQYWRVWNTPQAKEGTRGSPPEIFENTVRENIVLNSLSPWIRV